MWVVVGFGLALLTLIGVPILAVQHHLVDPGMGPSAIGFAAIGLVVLPVAALLFPRVVAIWGKIGWFGLIVAAVIAAIVGDAQAIAPMLMWAVALWLGYRVGARVALTRDLDVLQFMVTSSQLQRRTLGNLAAMQAALEAAEARQQVSNPVPEKAMPSASARSSRPPRKGRR